MTDVTFDLVPDDQYPDSAIANHIATSNPYDDPDFDGIQDDFEEEGLGAGNFASNLQTRINWRSLHDSKSTKLPDGQDITMHCLSCVRQMRFIGPLYFSAKTQAEGSSQRHLISYENVDWTKVPPGAPLIFRVGQYWHIAHFLGITKVGPLCWTTDVPRGQVSLVSPIYFRIHWGAELDSWLGDLEDVDLDLVIPGQEPHDPPKDPPHDPPAHVKWPQVQVTAVQVFQAWQQAELIIPEWDRAKAWKADLQRIWREMHRENYPV